VWAAAALGDTGLRVLDISKIITCVAMIPHEFRLPDHEQPVKLFFVMDKLWNAMWEIGEITSRVANEDGEDIDGTEEGDEDAIA
jgi:hypothetical protein